MSTLLNLPPHPHTEILTRGWKITGQSLLAGNSLLQLIENYHLGILVMIFNYRGPPRNLNSCHIIFMASFYLSKIIFLGLLQWHCILTHCLWHWYPIWASNSISNCSTFNPALCLWLGKTAEDSRSPWTPVHTWEIQKNL